MENLIINLKKRRYYLLFFTVLVILIDFYWFENWHGIYWTLLVLAWVGTDFIFKFGSIFYWFMSIVLVLLSFLFSGAKNQLISDKLAAWVFIFLVFAAVKEILIIKRSYEP